MMADKDLVMKYLKTAKGQVDGIIKMVENDKYCVDISHQLLAVEAMINKTNKEILMAHLKGCVNNAETQEERNRKIDELSNLLMKVLR
ncbi:MAG: metal-sensing transcriptional repressor [Erysipelotrichaceae bacterium]|nr:metal-sensing transcriptional repressor [Erysipelotrichaceae bacterium]